MHPWMWIKCPGYAYITIIQYMNVCVHVFLQEMCADNIALVTPHYMRALMFTVEPLLKDSPNKGHHINYLSTKDTF